MADSKISDLTDGAPAVATDIVPVARGATTRRLSLTNLGTLFATLFAALTHASRHENSGADEISVTGLSGLLADSQTPLAHKTSHEDGGSDEISVLGLSGLLADAQKVAIHKNGTVVGTRKNVNFIEGTNVTLTVADDSGDDEVDVTINAAGASGAPSTVEYIVASADAGLSAERVGTDTATIDWDYGTAAQAKLNVIPGGIPLDTLGAPTDITTLNASTSAHGLLPKLSNVSTEFLNGVGAFSTPAAGGNDPRITIVTLGSDATAVDTTTGAEITGLQRTGTGTGTFFFQYILRYQSTVASVGVKFGVNHTGTATVVASSNFVGAAVSPDQAVAAPEALGGSAARAFSTTAPNMGPTPNVDTADADMLMIINGHLIVTVDGDLELWFACETLTGDGTITIKTGSALIITKLA